MCGERTVAASLAPLSNAIAGIPDLIEDVVTASVTTVGLDGVAE